METNKLKECIMEKVIKFLEDREWLRILLTIVIFFVIATSEGKAYDLAGVAGVLYAFWLALKVFKFRE